MSSLVVDTNVLARHALGDLETAEEVAPAVQRLREQAGPLDSAAAREPGSLAMRMVVA